MRCPGVRSGPGGGNDAAAAVAKTGPRAGALWLAFFLSLSLTHTHTHVCRKHLRSAPKAPCKASCPLRSPARLPTMADAQVFEETFTITSVNSEKYDRVSRLHGTSTDSQITMSLDFNHELFPVEVGQTISLVLATTLALDGSAKGDNDSMWRSVGKQGVTTLADMYDYVCYGKNYRMEGGDGDVM